jgi:hypothetical protein
MAIIDTVIAGLDSGVSLEDLDAMSPAQLSRFARLCEHWALLANARTVDACKGPCRRPAYDPGSSRGRHGYAPRSLNAIYRPLPGPANDQPRTVGVLADLRDGRGRQ